MDNWEHQQNVRTQRINWVNGYSTGEEGINRGRNAHWRGEIN